MHIFAISFFGQEFSPLEILGLISAATLSLAAFIKAVKDIREYGWRPAKTKWLGWFNRGRENSSEIREIKDMIATLTATGERIENELKTNGGKSLKDVVNATGAAVQKIQARIDHKDEYDPQPIFHLDSNGGICYTNCAFRELVGAEDRDLMHRDYISRIVGASRAQFLSELHDAIVNKMPINAQVEFGPEIVRVQLSASPNVLPGGELLGYFGTASEVEAIERTETQPRLSRVMQ